jgi:hypothetical protein
MVDVSIKEGKMAVCFGWYSELNVLLVIIQVVKELQQVIWTMEPYDEHVIHVAKPAEGLVAYLLQSYFFQCTMKKLEMTGDSGKPMTTPLVCV